MHVILIHNPAAGDADQPSGDDIVELIRRAGHTVVYRSKDDDWQSALKEPADVIAVAGGDGIVGTVAKQCIGSKAPIAVLPLGTANNIANTLGLMDKPLDQLIAGWDHGRRIKFDIGLATGPRGASYFIEGVGVGLFTEIMLRLDAGAHSDVARGGDADEKISSVLEILNARASRYPAKELKVTLDGRDLSGDYILLEAMNIRAIGPNLYLAPEADPGDGFLDIVCVSKEERDKLTAYLTACLEGKSCSLGLTVGRGGRLRIESHNNFSVHVDDKAWPAADLISASVPAWIEVTLGRASVEFLTPGGAARSQHRE